MTGQLRIHFLNVGHGDCTFVEHPTGRISMIDVANSKAIPEEDKAALQQAVPTEAALQLKSAQRSWEDYYKEKMVDPLDYHREVLGSRLIHRYIQSHPDMDHMGGLAAFFGTSGEAELLNFWDVENSKEPDEAGFGQNGYDRRDWETYRSLGRGRDGVKRLLVKMGRTGEYWTEDGIMFLAPTEAHRAWCDSNEEWNDISAMLRIDHAGRSVILPGDAEAPAWNSVLANCASTSLRCDVLKAAHHGRQSGFHADAVEAMDPDTVICSVGKKPDTDAHEDYKAAGADVLSTRFHGTIVVTITSAGDLRVEDTDGNRLGSQATSRV